MQKLQDYPITAITAIKTLQTNRQIRNHQNIHIIQMQMDTTRKSQLYDVDEYKQSIPTQHTKHN
jgi:hypothetical protein